jgi:hypothetical protein
MAAPPPVTLPQACVAQCPTPSTRRGRARPVTGGGRGLETTALRPTTARRTSPDARGVLAVARGHGGSSLGGVGLESFTGLQGRPLGSACGLCTSQGRRRRPRKDGAGVGGSMLRGQAGALCGRMGRRASGWLDSVHARACSSARTPRQGAGADTHRLLRAGGGRGGRRAPPGRTCQGAGAGRPGASVMPDACNKPARWNIIYERPNSSTHTPLRQRSRPHGQAAGSRRAGAGRAAWAKL